MTLQTWTSAVEDFDDDDASTLTFGLPLERGSESRLVTPVPVSSRALASLLLNVCVRSLAPSLK
jgi:hypothetical protein